MFSGCVVRIGSIREAGTCQAPRHATAGSWPRVFASATCSSAGVSFNPADAEIRDVEGTKGAEAQLSLGPRRSLIRSKPAALLGAVSSPQGFPASSPAGPGASTAAGQTDQVGVPFKKLHRRQAVIRYPPVAKLRKDVRHEVPRKESPLRLVKIVIPTSGFERTVRSERGCITWSLFRSTDYGSPCDSRFLQLRPKPGPAGRGPP